MCTYVGSHTLLWTHNVTAKNVALCTPELTDDCARDNRDKFLITSTSQNVS